MHFWVHKWLFLKTNCTFSKDIGKFSGVQLENDFSEQCLEDKNSALGTSLDQKSADKKEAHKTDNTSLEKQDKVKNTLELD